MTALHIAFPYAAYLTLTAAMWQTLLFAYFLYLFSLIATTAGPHRLYTHKAYKAKTPMQVIILIFSTMAIQGSAFHWARDHRVHHKYCDTDADPHNSKRGFFYCHIGWTVIKKNPLVIAKGRAMDLSDLYSNRLLQFQDKYYKVLAILLGIVFPTFTPLLWGESYWTAHFVTVVFRVFIGLHFTFLINSAAHMWGSRPYDKEIRPSENWAVRILTPGEGYHNYHHTFPQDYRAAELGGYVFNTPCLFIDLMAKIGWAYDLKTAPEEFIEKRVKRSGDGTHPLCDEKVL
ncbi:acyl-CoA Delta(11) desaturase-like [Anticarsia gemmatalis]|uniref:acyl-CoA Delta(11) desaturase-like n=1 Tax=Anticarsia gemmatalis TaxID=129554 RepID=UPI003F76EB83